MAEVKTPEQIEAMTKTELLNWALDQIKEASE